MKKIVFIKPGPSGIPQGKEAVVNDLTAARFVGDGFAKYADGEAPVVEPVKELTAVDNGADTAQQSKPETTPGELTVGGGRKKKPQKEN